MFSVSLRCLHRFILSMVSFITLSKSSSDNPLYTSAVAKNMHRTLYPAFKKLFMAPNPVPVKAALAHRGLINEHVRKPLAVLNEAEKEELFAVIDSIKAELGN